MTETMTLLNALPRFFTRGEACWRLGMNNHQLGSVLCVWRKAGLVGICTRRKRTREMVFWKLPKDLARGETPQQFLQRIGREAMEDKC